MTPKQKRFCDEYLIDTDGAKAAIRAGYSERSAKQIASELLTKPDLREYIDQRLAEMESDTIAKATEVMQYLTSVLRGKSKSEIVVVEGIGDGCSEARRMTKAPDEKEKLKAAEMLAKRYRLLTEKISVDGAVPVVIVDDVSEE